MRSKVGQQLRKWSRGWHRTTEGWKRALVTWSIAALIGLFLLVIGLLLLSPVGRVEEIRVSRADPRLDIEEVQKILSPLFKQHLLVLSARQVRDLLSVEIPDIQEVHVRKRYPSQLFVQIDLEPLIARLEIVDPEQEQRADSLTQSGSTFDYLTSGGIYVTTSVVEKSKALPLLRVVDWGVRPAPEDALLSTEFIRRMEEIEGILTTQFGQQVNARTVYLRAQEFHLRVGTVSLWFDVRGSLEDQMRRFRTFLGAVGLANAREYVDLRLSGRVIFK